MDNMTRFILAGHSFGGYICGLYASRYHQHVVKLLLLSPAGAAIKPDDFDIYKEIESTKSSRKPPKFAIKLAPKIWAKKWSPYAVLRFGGRPLSRCFFRRYAKRRLYSLTNPEINNFREYLE
jgi:pimeloyl-ACP methyl ester carboxylesterase